MTRSASVAGSSSEAATGNIAPSFGTGRGALSRRHASAMLRPRRSTVHLGLRFERALVYALHVHGGHVRKATDVPYFSHLMAVSATVIENGGSENEAIAALLHDAVEDQGGRPRLNDIHDRFGAEVANTV